MGTERFAPPSYQTGVCQGARQFELKIIESWHCLTGLQQDSVADHEFVQNYAKRRRLKRRANATYPVNRIAHSTRSNRNTDERYMKPLGFNPVVSSLKPVQLFAQVPRQFGWRAKGEEQGVRMKGWHGDSGG
jgi:hypothetical protein